MQQWRTHQKNIISNFLGDLIDQSGVTVWQQFGENRLLYSAKVRDITQDKCTVELEHADVLANPPKEGEPFYLHAKLRDLAFKKEDLQISGNMVEFNLPTGILVRERRGNDRLRYRFQDQKLVVLAAPENQKGLLGILSNISEKGMLFLIEKKLGIQLKVNDELDLIKLMDHGFDNSLKTVIRHTTNYIENDVDYLKIGIEFVDGPNEKILSTIKDKKARTLGLLPGEYCGLDFEEQIDKLNIIEKDNKQLAINIRKNLDQLERIRYMTGIMKVQFIEMVDHNLLACSLRLSSKELIYDLLMELSKNLREEFLEKLSVAKPASAVCKAQDTIIKILKEKEKDGDFRMDPKNVTTYV